ncbi:MAG: hypothetical protein LUF33_05895 [Clostridiales bacterium]|nr:hypothetical protein [Clostridiales bacterium]
MNLKRNNRKSKKRNANSVEISDKGKFAIVESYKTARTNIMFSLSATDKMFLPLQAIPRARARVQYPQTWQFHFQSLRRKSF